MERPLLRRRQEVPRGLADHILLNFNDFRRSLREDFGVSCPKNISNFFLSLAEKVRSGTDPSDVKLRILGVRDLFYEIIKYNVAEAVLKDPSYQKLQKLAKGRGKGRDIANGILNLLDSYKSTKFDSRLLDKVQSRVELYDLIDAIDPDDEDSLPLLRDAVKRVPRAISDVAGIYLLEIMKYILMRVNKKSYRITFRD